VGVGNNCTLETFGGLPYEDWKAGKPFTPGTEMRRSTCPAWWYQCTDYDKKPNWDECGFGVFSKCKHFAEKQRCWERSDSEQLLAEGDM
jgi:hypothetical protein